MPKKMRELTSLVIGIYGAGSTGEGSSNADVKAIADAVGGKMYNGPGNVPHSIHWALPIFTAIDAHYLGSGTQDMQSPGKIVIFGYSMGGRAAVALAVMMGLRKQYRHIKVALAGIDPVELRNEPIALALPDNVFAWINYYQQDETGQGIVDFKLDIPPVNINCRRISGGPLKAGPKTGPGANYRLTEKSEGLKVDHVEMPSLPKVKRGVTSFIGAHR